MVIISFHLTLANMIVSLGGSRIGIVKMINCSFRYCYLAWLSEDYFILAFHHSKCHDLCFNRCQEVLLESMVVGENIARNAALRENVFMMAVCVDLRIPLFLVGKPGSSKSLAKAIVADSMRGPASQNELLKSFKQVSVFNCVF